MWPVRAWKEAVPERCEIRVPVLLLVREAETFDDAKEVSILLDEVLDSALKCFDLKIRRMALGHKILNVHRHGGQHYLSRAIALFFVLLWCQLVKARDRRDELLWYRNNSASPFAIIDWCGALLSGRIVDGGRPEGACTGIASAIVGHLELLKCLDKKDIEMEASFGRQELASLAATAM